MAMGLRIQSNCGHAILVPMKRLTLLFCMVAAATMLAQVVVPGASPGAQTQRVLIGCLAKDERPVTLTLDSLSAKDIKLTGISPLGDQSFDYVLVYDASNSTRALGKSGLYLSQLLLRSATRTGKDRGSLVTFDSIPDAARGFTTNPEDILKAVGKAQIGGGTALYDALMRAMKKLDEIGRDAPRFVFLISDGDDNQSRATSKDVANALLLSHTRLIAVYPFSGFSWNERGYSILSRMAGVSGGWSLEAKSAVKQADVENKNRKTFETLSRLFQSWTSLQLQTPSGAGDLLPFALRTTAGCKLVAPSFLAISSRRSPVP